METQTLNCSLAAGQFGREARSMGQELPCPPVEPLWVTMNLEVDPIVM
jgi:hypothetical protein